MSRFLVTGGCGFIGSHLCDALVERGDEVWVLDDLSSGSPANLPAGIRMIIGDIADRFAVREALGNVDGCFHLAAIASVARAQQDWLGCHRTNLTGTITLLDEIHRRGDAGRIPVVYASSAAVYGDCNDSPIDEDAVKRPISGYGSDKYGCELQALVATHNYEIPTTGLRFFNVYGPRQAPNSPYSGVISIFADRLRRREAVSIHGDGAQTRDFVAVRDVVQALLRAMQARLPGAPVFNVCTGQPTSILELAMTIGELCGYTPDPTFGPARAGDIRRSVGSPARAGSELGFFPKLDLRSGLSDLLASMDSTSPPPDHKRPEEVTHG